MFAFLYVVAFYCIAEAEKKLLSRNVAIPFVVLVAFSIFIHQRL